MVPVGYVFYRNAMVFSFSASDFLTLAKSHRGEADFSLLSLHESMAHFGSILRTKKVQFNIFLVTTLLQYIRKDKICLPTIINDSLVVAPCFTGPFILPS